MSTPTVPEHYPETWSRSWVPALQQADGRLISAATMDTVTGDRKWYNIGGTIDFKRKTARYPDTTYVDYSTEKSWLYPEAWNAPVLLDEYDQTYLDTIVRPDSRIMADQAAGYARLRDEYIKNAVQGTRVTGASGSTTETFPAANIVAVDEGAESDDGLNWGKITETTNIMDKAHVPLNDRFFVIGAEQKKDLMSLAQATDRDYANTMLIKAGQIHGTFWAGFTWLQYEDLDFDATDTDARKCLAFYKPDIILAESGLTTRMDILPEKDYAVQIHASTLIGSCRVNNSSVIVLCKES